MIAGATRIIAPATARHAASQFVPRNAGGIRAAEARKSMRTAKMAKFRITIKMNVGFSARWRSGSLLAIGPAMAFPVLVRILRLLILPPARQGLLTHQWVTLAIQGSLLRRTGGIGRFTGVGRCGQGANRRLGCLLAPGLRSRRSRP